MEKKGQEREFQNPCSVCMDGDGRVVVAEFENNRIQVLTKDGKPVFKFGDNGPEKLDQPTGCVYYKNMFIVSDSFNHCLKLFDNYGKFLYKIGEKGGLMDKYRYLGVCVLRNLLVFSYVTETMVVLCSSQWKVIFRVKPLLR